MGIETLKMIYVLTLETVSVEEVLALLMALDAAFPALEALSGQSPEQALTLEAEGGLVRTPDLEVVGSGARDGVDERLQRALEHCQFLNTKKHSRSEQKKRQ